MGNKRLYQIMKEKDALYMKEDFSEEDGIKASELEAEFATMNGWEAESDAASLLNGLGIDTDLHYKFVKDQNKFGWEYKSIKGIVKRYEQIDNTIILKNKFKISLEDILLININR